MSTRYPPIQTYEAWCRIEDGTPSPDVAHRLFVGLEPAMQYAIKEGRGASAREGTRTFDEWRDATAADNGAVRMHRFSLVAEEQQQAIWDNLGARCDRRNELARRCYLDDVNFDTSMLTVAHRIGPWYDEPEQLKASRPPARPSSLAKFPDDDPIRAAKEEIRAVPTAEYLGKLFGAEFNRHGYASCCFHDERTPSLRIVGEQGFVCFGCQAKGGSAYDAGAHLYGLDPVHNFVELTELLAAVLLGRRVR
ncbi:MAG: hypothetical protein QOF36_964 [Microbacteriaceae bacterium]|jgi:hypothetical protein|nr:hypothetical protein [Microbacteriaceae bacterium]